MPLDNNLVLDKFFNIKNEFKNINELLFKMKLWNNMKHFKRLKCKFI